MVFKAACLCRDALGLRRRNDSMTWFFSSFILWALLTFALSLSASSSFYWATFFLSLIFIPFHFIRHSLPLSFDLPVFTLMFTILWWLDDQSRLWCRDLHSYSQPLSAFFFLFDKWVTGRLEALLLHWFGIDSVSHALLVEWRPGLFKRTKCGIVCLITCNISGVLWVGHGFNSQKRLAWCSFFHTCWCELHLKERRTRNTHWTICLKHC